MRVFSPPTHTHTHTSSSDDNTRRHHHASLRQHNPIGRTTNQPPRRTRNPPPLTSHPHRRTPLRHTRSIRLHRHEQQPPRSPHQLSEITPIDQFEFGWEWDNDCGWEEFEEKCARVEEFGADGEWGEGMECAGGFGGGVSEVGVFEFGWKSCDE